MPFIIYINLSKKKLVRQRYDGIVWYSPSIFFGPLIYLLKRHNSCKTYLILRDIFPKWALDMGIIRKSFPYYFFKLNEYIHIPHLKITGKVSKMSLRLTELLPEKGYPILIDNDEFNTHPVINLSRRKEVFILSILMIDLCEKDRLRSILQEAKEKLTDKDSAYPDGWLMLSSIDDACFKVVMGMTLFLTLKMSLVHQVMIQLKVILAITT